MSDFSALYSPGVVVTRPDQPQWGRGQVQSNINGKVTVNFENTGKVVLDVRHVALEIVSFDQ